ncbi:ATP-dependent nuclease [Aeromicrobium sp. JJY06]|uniref:ATP-dependent nuclease n=1 Tax=Aeromicrobium sp. JJY06 TaxID=3373478 RepID=UPI00376F0BE7
MRSLQLVNYKGFRNHSISFRETNVLVGANNSGKSTALGALRLLAAMLPRARSVRPDGIGQIEGRVQQGWRITAKAIEASAFSDENIRHDFRLDETRIELTVNNGARLVASWPDLSDLDDDQSAPGGTFFVFPPDGGKILQPRQVAKDRIPDIAVVPTLTPLDDREAHISDDTLRRHRTSKRSSRYFRNALDRLTQDEWDEFRAFVYERTPEISNLGLHRALGTVEDDYDLFFEEEGTRREREIGWAGDGIQIWIQALFHIWRQKESPVLILDEPDVFLHPDLQRRLARALFSNEQQTILATHSIEILAEAEPGSAVWIDRSRRRAERPRAGGALGLVGRRLGSGYELGIGRALRSRLALFVEGDDVPIIALLARNLGESAVASSDLYATVPLGGFSRNAVAGAFAEAIAAIGAEVQTVVVLDSDLRSQDVLDSDRSDLVKAGAAVHIWRRRELENYLLSAASIAKVSGVSIDEAEALLSSALDASHSEALTTLQAQRLAERRAKGSKTGHLSEKSVLEASNQEFAERWKSESGRLALVDAKAVIRRLNTALQARKAKTVNAHALAKNIPRTDMHSDVEDLVRMIAAKLAAH